MIVILNWIMVKQVIDIFCDVDHSWCFVRFSFFVTIYSSLHLIFIYLVQFTSIASAIGHQALLYLGLVKLADAPSDWLGAYITSYLSIVGVLVLYSIQYGGRVMQMQVVSPQTLVEESLTERSALLPVRYLFLCDYYCCIHLWHTL